MAQWVETVGRDAGSYEPRVGTALRPWGTVPGGTLPLTIAYCLPGRVVMQGTQRCP